MTAIESRPKPGAVNETVTVDLRQASIGADDLPAVRFPVRAPHTRARPPAGCVASQANSPTMSTCARHRVRSVLCIPLLKQTRLAGIIYLENNLTSGAFTPARMALLEAARVRGGHLARERAPLSRSSGTRARVALDRGHHSRPGCHLDAGRRGRSSSTTGPQVLRSGRLEEMKQWGTNEDRSS